jgi:hypothetical protein
MLWERRYAHLTAARVQHGPFVFFGEAKANAHGGFCDRAIEVTRQFYFNTANKKAPVLLSGQKATRTQTWQTTRLYRSYLLHPQRHLLGA